MTNIALVRGINVGGHKPIRMADLRGLLESLSCTRVASLLQSGNLVFVTDARRSAASMEQLFEAGAAKRLGLQADFFVRTAKEWRSLVVGNPFRKEADEAPGRLIAVCLKDAPSKSQLQALRKAITGPETVHGSGRHLYIVFPDGMGVSRLTTAVIEKTLCTRGTARNWNTVLKLDTLANDG